MEKRIIKSWIYERLQLSDKVTFVLISINNIYLNYSLMTFMISLAIYNFSRTYFPPNFLKKRRLENHAQTLQGETNKWLEINPSIQTKFESAYIDKYWVAANITE